MQASGGPSGGKNHRLARDGPAKKGSELILRKRGEMARYYPKSDWISVALSYFPRHIDDIPSKTAEITQSEDLARIRALLDEIPACGQIMKKLGPDAELLVLSVVHEQGVSRVLFYDGRIKTTDTSFLVGENKAETELASLLKSHLSVNRQS